jgi:hypothetical protein
MLQTEVTYKAKKINNVKYLNTKYKDDQFVCIYRSQPHKLSTKYEVKKYNGRNGYRTIMSMS